MNLCREDINRIHRWIDSKIEEALRNDIRVELRITNRHDGESNWKTIEAVVSYKGDEIIWSGEQDI